MNVIAAQSWNDLSPQLKTTVAVLLAVQITLAAIALVVWWKTPDSRMPPPNRPAWAVIVLLGQIPGVVLFFILRAKASREAALREADATGPARATDRGEVLDRAVHALYGSSTPGSQR